MAYTVKQLAAMSGVSGQMLRAHTGETVFLPRKVTHGWTAVDRPGRVLDTYQPAGKMEDFFREVGRFTTPPIHEALGIDGLSTLFKAHGMDLMGAPVTGQWTVDEQGRIRRIA